MGTGGLTPTAHGDGIGQQDDNEGLMISCSSVSICAFGGLEKEMTEISKLNHLRCIRTGTWLT